MMIDDNDLKILIADDEPLAAERLQMLLARIDGVHLVGTAHGFRRHCRPFQFGQHHQLGRKRGLNASPDLRPVCRRLADHPAKTLCGVFDDAFVRALMANSGQLPIQ